MDRESVERVASEVVDGALAVHKALGPGLLESTYESCLAYELHERGLSVERQLELPVIYRSVRIDAGYRIDMLVERCVVIELKAVERTLPVHEAQLLAYLRLSGHRLGFLINFHVPLLRDGIKRMVDRY